MAISSRTPEGWPTQCPVCATTVVLDVPGRFGDVPCPACGCLLWFVRWAGNTWLFDPRQVDALELAAVKARLQGELDSIGSVETVLRIESLAGG